MPGALTAKYKMDVSAAVLRDADCCLKARQYFDVTAFVGDVGTGSQTVCYWA